MTNKKKDVESIHYLSPLQQGLLFHAVSDRAADPYFTQTGFLLEGNLDPETFARAWQAIVDRHPILRTGFVWEGVARPVQIVRPRGTIPLERLDWRGLGAREREEALAARMAADRLAGFDFLRPPLMRLTLIQVTDDAWYFINSHHHILLDGWSFALLLREALISYKALVRKTEPALPPARPYRDYLAWVQGQNEETAERFWRGALAGFRTPTPLPMDASSEAAPARDDALPYAEQELRLSQAEPEALAAFARRHRITLNTLVQGAWALLLQRHSGEPEVVFGTTVSGRPPDLPGCEAIVGLLINTLPVRVRMGEHEPLAPWLQRLQDLNSELRQYEWTPLSRIQRWSEVPGGRSLFDTLVVFDSYPEESMGEAPMDVRVRALPRPCERVGSATLTAGRNNYPLSLIVEPTRELRLVLCYERRRLSHDAATALLEQYRTLLGAMVARPQAPLTEPPLVDGAERRRLLVDWNATATVFPEAMCVHELFEAQAERRPDALAVVCEETTLTYRELDRRANQVARRLRALGVGPEDRIGLCVERSLEMIVGLLGVLKAGAAYVPLDPKFPREWLRSVVADSGARALVTQERWEAALDEPGLPLLCLDRDLAILSTEPSAPLGVTARPGNLAYLIYTSGSTGLPKGVAVEHRQLVNYVRGVLARLPLPEDASLALVSTVAADLGHTSLFGALCSGRTLHVLSNDRTFDPDATAAYMHRHRVDALKIVPSHLSALLEAAQPERVLPRRCLVLGGEAANGELIDRIRALAPDCAILNHYGPTETTVGALTWQVDAAFGQPAGKLPIGRPLANVQAYVLDRHMEPVPVGVSGELYIGGAGVARGYLGRPELTAERFVPHPFGASSGGRLYWTGDRARYRPDGAIEFLGRTDHQIKLRGHRIELGEIEAHLREQPEVREAVVVAREDSGTKRLVAYVVSRETAPLDTAALLARLAQRLPDPMVPSAIVPLPALPLTANGKIDRAALPDPEPLRASRAGRYVAPRTELEVMFAQIWAEVLRRERVGIDDDFFDLGGDSILSLQIIARVNQKGLRITPKQLFAHRTIAALAGALARASARPELPAPRAAMRAPFSLARLEPAQLEALRRTHGDDLEDACPASPVQQGMLFHGLLTPEMSPYFNQIVCQFSHGLDLEAFTQAWRALSARHAILRTGFLLDGVAEPHQVVRRTVRLPLEVLDWRGLSDAEQRTALDQYLRQDRARGFRFQEPPLMRLAVMRLQENVYQVAWSVHHAVLDGWCQGLMVKEWLGSYEELRRGSSEPREAAPPYRDYVAWLQRQDMAAAESFWRAHLKGFTEPTRIPAPAGGLSDHEPQGVREHRECLSRAATTAVQGFAQAQRVTLNTLVQAAWALVLARYSGAEDVLFGVTMAGRPADLPDAESMMGVFINSLPLRLRVPPVLRLAEWLQQVQALNLELRQYEYSPLVQVQGWSEVGRGASLFDTLLVFQNYPMDDAVEEHRRALGIEVRTQEAWTNYPLTLYVVPGGELTLLFSYDAQRLDKAIVSRMAEHMCALLTRMTAEPEAPLAELPLLSASERQRLVVEWNATRRDHLPDAVLPERIAEQARRTPKAVAVTCGERHLTYEELNARADQLARYLRGHGGGPETLIGLYLERSPEMLIGMLGILKAGGAYVPLDPGYPRERLRHIVEDSRLSLLLTQEGLEQALPVTRARSICLDRDWPSIAGACDRDPSPLVRDEMLAYVIYTSGSTGRPKGVMVRHGSVTNFLLSMSEHLAPGRDVVVLATTSISFDIAVLELFLPLLVGGRVVLARREDAADGERLAALLRASGATWMQATPTAWKMLLESGRPRLTGLTVLCGGEAFPRELARAFLDAGVAPWNLYGPTETTVWSSLHRVTSGHGLIPLGRPIANTQIYVLDRQLQPVPIGAAGEVYIGGAGLARGYLHRPDLTAERFVPDPFSQDPGCRLYGTGDLARFGPDGTLEFLGRLDDQLKMRGFRIEPGEIEAQLQGHPDVREAVVVARQESGIARLCAYVVPAQSAPPPADGLRSFLKERLPDYMVPSAYVWLDGLPLTPNGKVNRKALPAPGLVSREQTTRTRTATEEILGGIWADVLGLGAVDGHESFFELGGHSLLATQVVSRVRKALGVELPLRSLFDHPTVAALGRDIDQRRAGRAAAEAPPLLPVPRQGPLPLSFAQQRLWFLAQLEPDSAGYNMTTAVRITGDLDLALLKETFRALAQRHEALRTTFGMVNGEPVQLIAPDGAPTFEVVDLTTTPAAEHPAAVQRLASARAQQAFDLGRGPLVRVTAIKCGDDEHVLVLVVHHIVADGWTMNVLVTELGELYAAARAGRPPALQPLPIQYADFAVWQRQWMRGAVRDAHLAYWRQQLGGYPPALDLRPDHCRPAAGSYRGARHVMTVGRELAEALRALGRREGATLFMTLLAAFKVLLFGRTGQTDLLVGTDVAGRNREETEGLIGFFVNLLVLRTDLGSLPTFRELLHRVREVTLDAYAHQDLPFEQVVDALRPVREPGRHPLVQTLFVLQNMPASDLALPGIRLSAVELDGEVSRFDLGVFVEETDEGLRCAWKYRADLFEPSTVEGMAAQFLAVLRAIVDDPARRVRALADAERKERLMEGHARDERRPRSLKRITPRKVAMGPDALVSTSFLGTEPLPLVIQPAVDDVDLAAWAREEWGFIEAQLLRHGAVLFRGFPLRSVPEFEQVAQAVCGELFGEYGDLPREKSGRHVYGSTPYPADKTILFHNESSHLPRWPLKQWFFCVQAAADGGATPIVDCRRLYEALAPEVRERFRRSGLLYVRNFTPGFDVSWQDFFQTTDPAVVEERCRSGGMQCAWLQGGRLRISQRGPAVVSHPRTGERVFFNQVQLHHPAYLEAPVRDSLLAMLGEEWLPRNVYYGDGTPLDVATTRALGEVYARSAVRFPWREGDLLLLDNMLIAHGRDPFAGPRKIVVAMAEMVTHQARAADAAVEA